MLRVALTASALIVGIASPAAAQPPDVGLVVDADAADEAFLQFVAVPPAHRFSGADAARADGEIAFVVELRAADGVAQIWRRSDRATLERRLEEPDPEGYALAVMGAELLEVARAGSMSEVVAVDPPGADDAEDPAGGPAEDGAPTTTAPALGDRLAFTGAIAFEAWGMPEADAPFQLQPALALELAFVPAGEDWQLGAGIFAAGFGQFGRSVGGVEAGYQRYDLGARVTFGGALGPVRTRLLGHLRVGGAAIEGRAQDEGGGNPRAGSATLAGLFLGPALEVRQPVFEGLEVTLGVAADVVVEPVSFTADGGPVVEERPLRLSARLGVAYRVE